MVIRFPLAAIDEGEGLFAGLQQGVLVSCP